MMLRDSARLDGGDVLRQDIDLLRATLERDRCTLNLDAVAPPWLVVLCGLPGTGKSHFAKRLTARLPFLVLESDRLRKVLFVSPSYTPDEHARVFAACHNLIEEYLSLGCRVLFDATNITESFRRPLYEISERLCVPLTLVWVTAPRGVIRRRLADRAAGRDSATYSDADWQVYSRLQPYEEPLTRCHLKVDSSTDNTPVLDRIVGLVSE